MRSSFHSAVDGFVELVGAVPAGRFDDPALGAWTVRDLIGHASRALSTIEDYCGRESDGPIVDGPTEYFALAGASPPGSDARRKRDESIAERGKRAGVALGDEPATAVRALAERVTALVDATEDEMPMATAAGRMTLVGYLPTRTFELVVHGLDLAGALDIPIPPTLGPAIAASTALAGKLAAARPEAPLVLLALCGRRNLPDTFSVT